LSGVVHGRTTRWVGAAVAAVTFLSVAGPALANSPPTKSSGGAGFGASMPFVFGHGDSKHLGDRVLREGMHGHDVRVLTLPVFRNDALVEVVQVGMSLAQRERTLRRYFQSLLVLVPLAVVLAASGGALMARAALRPVDQMSAAARRITAEALGQRVRVQGTLDETGKKTSIGLFGVSPAPVSIFKAVPLATVQTVRITGWIAQGAVQLISGQRSRQDVGGPIRIAQFAGQAASLGVLPFIQLLALLSINLGFINLLPVPLMDGGHLFFYAVEGVRRRPISERALEWAFRSGLAVILALVAFTTINDLGSIGLWDRLQRLIG